jgi:deazaflavin-dependent oxidoreductase (nitroreductase family)
MIGSGLARLVAGLVLVVVGAVGAVLASSLAPRVIRRNPHMLRHGVFKSWNDFNRKNAGSRLSPFALLRHVGRRSGRTYETPLGAHPYSDGFLLPLTYGVTTDWYQNLVAAGTCTLVRNGRTHELERPEVISGPGVMRLWPVWQRIPMRGAGVQEFVWLHAR